MDLSVEHEEEEFTQLEHTSTTLSSAKHELLYKTFKRFAQFHEAADASSEKILSCSQDYRAYLESFEEQCDESLAPQVVSMRLTWHLAEIFLLGPQETMLPELVGWLQELVRSPGDRDLEAMMASGQDADLQFDEAFWPYVHQCVRRGELASAWHVLQMHSALQSRTKEVRKLEHIFFTFPLQPSQGLLHDYEELWREWKARVVDFSRTKWTIMSGEGFSEILVMFLGDDEAIARLELSWAEVLLIRLLYTVPSINRRSVTLLLKKCAPQSDSHDYLKDTYAIARAVMEGQVASAVYQSSVFYSHKYDITFHLCWFHLLDLFNAAGLLDQDPIEQYDTRLRDTLAIEYSMELNEMHVGVDIVCTYLGTCDAEPDHWIREVILRRERTCDSDVHATVRLLQYHGLEKYCLDVYMEAGMEWCKRGQLGKAAWWFLLANDTTRLAVLCDSALISYMAAFAAHRRLKVQFKTYQRTLLARTFTAEQDVHSVNDTIAHAKLEESERLQAARRDAEAVADSIADRQVEECAELASLKQYVKVMQLVLEGLPRADNTLQATSLQSRSIQRAGELVIDMIRSVIIPPDHITIRYVLHMVELCVWIDIWHCELSPNDQSPVVFSPEAVLTIHRLWQMFHSSHRREEILEELDIEDREILREQITHLLIKSMMDRNRRVTAVVLPGKSSTSLSSSIPNHGGGASALSIQGQRLNIEQEGRWDDLTVPLPLALW